MTQGRRARGLLFTVCALAALCAAPAQAYVYWSADGAGAPLSGGTTLGRVNADGTGVTHSLVTTAANPGPIATDGTHIYWFNLATQTIARANVDGTGATPNWLPLSTSVGGLAVDASHLYWTDFSRHIGRVNLDGSSHNATFIDTGAGSDPLALAAGSGVLYYSAGNKLMRIAATGVGGSTPVATLTADTIASSLATAGGYLYWGSVNTAGSSGIGRVQLNGQGYTDSYIPNLTFPSGVATDGTYIYWADNGVGRQLIGRALLGTVTATNRNDSFVSEPAGVYGVAVDGRVDPTRTALSCSPSPVPTGNPATCTATVADTDPASPLQPTGSVNVTGNGAAFFSGNPCTLTPSGPSSASCVVGAVPTTAGGQSFHAAYAGDGDHAASAADFAICAGTALQCGSSQQPPPGKPKPPCVVPKLKGKTLAGARTLLSKAHCRLGKITRPHARKGHPLGALVVGSQQPAAGRRLANAGKVAVHLVKAPKRKR